MPAGLAFPRPRDTPKSTRCRSNERGNRIEKKVVMAFAAATSLPGRGDLLWNEELTGIRSAHSTMSQAAVAASLASAVPGDADARSLLSELSADALPPGRIVCDRNVSPTSVCSPH